MSAIQERKECNPEYKYQVTDKSILDSFAWGDS